MVTGWLFKSDSSHIGACKKSERHVILVVQQPDLSTRRKESLRSSIEKVSAMSEARMAITGKKTARIKHANTEGLRDVGGC